MKATKKTTAAGSTFSDFERAAMKERALELKAEANKADGEKTLLAKIAQMPEPDRTMAKRVHAIVMANAPSLMPKTWYGMPAYANRDGKVVCFFQSGHKYKSRYCTFGFQDAANLDEGNMWPASFALKKIVLRRRGKDRRTREKGCEVRPIFVNHPYPPSEFLSFTPAAFIIWLELLSS